jgi:hypothetical protein
MFQKSYTVNILRIGQNDHQNSYFSRMKDEDQTGTREGSEGTLTTRGRGQALAVPTCGEAPLVHS